ncbi:MAG: helical backbone metal receptor, partial [Saprospiraceae bacterium]|nr:helical backbone metal receptor [Saprospiraceae bacterium]
LSGAITETLYTLGHGDKIVGVDVTSTYPAEANQLPKVGHVRQLNAEGILGLKPDLIIAEISENNSPALQQLEQSGLEILWLEKTHSLDAPLQMAQKIAEKLGDPAGKLEQLSKKIKAKKQDLQSLIANKTNTPKVLFIYARGKGNLMVAGKNTAAEAMIQAAGGQNAVTEFTDFQALSAEGLIKAQPDIILMFDSGLQSVNGADELLKIPGISQTPAGQNQRIITMDGHYLLGFGPRATEAAIELAKKL